MWDMRASGPSEPERASSRLCSSRSARVRTASAAASSGAVAALGTFQQWNPEHELAGTSRVRGPVATSRGDPRNPTGANHQQHHHEDVMNIATDSLDGSRVQSEPPLPGSSAELVPDATLRRVITAASVGTLFEWYDFYLYGSLAVFFGKKFFPAGNDTAQLLASLATFGAGFGVRPLGAVVFGHIGDLIGRKYTFLVTMATMGLSTALIGFLPSYATLGLGATALLVLLRLAQGLALGGEYGGAATYVAEHVPDNQRGYYTSYIQTTATVGFFVSMLVIGTTRHWFGEEAFADWGWRIPFLLSFLLLAVSLYIRLQMQESPLFKRLKAGGKTSRNPFKEAFANSTNLKYVAIALFGATAGQGVVWYTGQFYALTFLQSALHVSWQTSYLLVSIALAIAAPMFVVFGALSDRVGRKGIMVTGCILAVLTYYPIYRA